MYESIMTAVGVLLFIICIVIASYSVYEKLFPEDTAKGQSQDAEAGKEDVGSCDSDKYKN